MALLSEDEVREALAKLDGWWLEDRAIEREWKLADFTQALDFVRRVGALAQAADHHPDILLHGWNKVRLTLSTHSAGGLTQADLALAAQIEDLL